MDCSRESHSRFRVGGDFLEEIPLGIEYVNFRLGSGYVCLVGPLCRGFECRIECLNGDIATYYPAAIRVRTRGARFHIFAGVAFRAGDCPQRFKVVCCLRVVQQLEPLLRERLQALHGVLVGQRGLLGDGQVDGRPFGGSRRRSGSGIRSRRSRCGSRRRSADRFRRSLGSAGIAALAPGEQKN